MTSTTATLRADHPTGKALLAYNRHLAARKRLDAECDEADRELEEALAVLLTAASGLVEDVDGSEEHGSDDKGFNVLAGGGVAQEVESNDSEAAGVNEVAPAACGLFFAFRDAGSADLKAGHTARLYQIESAADQGRPKKNSVLSDELAKA